MIVDFIGRFETLQADFDHVCQQLGVPPARLPQINRSPRVHPQRRSYVEYYDTESAEWVERLYRKDIELFGYQFGDEASGPAVAVASGGTK